MRQDKTSLRVILADTSSFVRLVLTAILNAEPGIEVVAAVNDAQSLVELTKKLRPDLVLVDINLPGNSRLFSLSRLHNECPTPVLLLGPPADLTEAVRAEARRLGTYNFIEEPSGHLRPQLRLIGEEIVAKVKGVREKAPKPVVNVERYGLPVRKKARVPVAPAFAVVLGGSTGGTQAVKTILRSLDPGFQGVLLVAVHLPKGFSHTLAARLQELTPLKVLEARPGLQIEAGQVIVAQGGNDLLVHPFLSLHGLPRLIIPPLPSSAYDHPSVDRLMQSAAALFGSQTLGIVLSGMGNDGTKGLSAIARAGGLTIAQDQQSSVIFGMPKSAIENGEVHRVLPLSEIAALLSRCARFEQLTELQPLSEPS